MACRRLVYAIHVRVRPIPPLSTLPVLQVNTLLELAFLAPHTSLHVGKVAITISPGVPPTSWAPFHGHADRQPGASAGVAPGAPARQQAAPVHIICSIDHMSPPCMRGRDHFNSCNPCFCCCPVPGQRAVKCAAVAAASEKQTDSHRCSHAAAFWLLLSHVLAAAGPCGRRRSCNLRF